MVLNFDLEVNASVTIFLQTQSRELVLVISGLTKWCLKKNIFLLLIHSRVKDKC